jgi:hypothetical protein
MEGEDIMKDKNAIVKKLEGILCSHHAIFLYL